MKKIFASFTVLLIIGLSPAQSQTDQDAFRYSRLSTGGTARSAALSGAFGALGGDFSTLASNPAGIGIYRVSEFSLTPTIYVEKTESKFLLGTQDDTKFNFNFGNIGLVYTKKLTNDQTSPGWKSWNFGFGYNRINNFHNRSYYEGFNDNNSLTNYFAENAAGLHPDDLDPFYEQLAWNTFLINNDSVQNYTAEAPNGQILQRRSQESRGAIGEMDFTFGGNFSNKFYLGGSLGFSTLRYVEESNYEEIDKNNLIDSLAAFEFNQNLNTRGVGFNFKFGAIYKINEWVRIGGAIHTPTWYSLHDDFSSEIKSRFDSGRTYQDESIGEFDYEMTTPFKAIGSIAFVFGKLGLLSADYEFSDLSGARIDATDVNFTETNSVIRKKYRESGMLRIGTEWRFANLSLRGGAAFTSSPMSSSYKVNGYDFTEVNYSGGIGIRDNHTYLDFGYVYHQSKEYFQAYSLSSETVPGVKNTMTAHSFLVTFGVKF
ncbi:MAG TPA: hypothetical protein PKJ62_04385 [Bacteroidia bacterium]|nr:hypothetical protein [Bacteroidia bacterium]